jgi:hypothetical protein
MGTLIWAKRTNELRGCTTPCHASTQISWRDELASTWRSFENLPHTFIIVGVPLLPPSPSRIKPCWSTLFPCKRKKEGKVIHREYGHFDLSKANKRVKRMHHPLSTSAQISWRDELASAWSNPQWRPSCRGHGGVELRELSTYLHHRSLCYHLYLQDLHHSHQKVWLWFLLQRFRYPNHR